MRPPSTLKHKQWPPDYVSVFQWRQEQLNLLYRKPELIAGALAYYAEHPIEFINHWVDTFDPRNAFEDLPTRLPLVLFQRQAELVEFVYQCLKDQ